MATYAQHAELIALTRACHPDKDQMTNIHTYSCYAFDEAHDFACSGNKLLNFFRTKILKIVHKF